MTTYKGKPFIEKVIFSDGSVRFFSNVVEVLKNEDTFELIFETNNKMWLNKNYVLAIGKKDDMERSSHR